MVSANTRLALIFLLLVCGSNSGAQVIKEHEISIEQWKTVSKALKFPASFPNLMMYDPDGKCVASLEPSKTWSASSLSPPEKLEPDPECNSFISEGIGSTAASGTGMWTIRLNVLGYDICGACVHAENELRAWVNQDPESRQLTIARIYGPDHFGKQEADQH